MTSRNTPQTEFVYHRWAVRVYRSHRRKRLSIQVAQPGLVHALAPVRLSLSAIKSFLQAQLTWLNQQELAKELSKEQQAGLPKHGNIGETWWFRGKQLALTDRLTLNTKPFLRNDPDQLVCYWPEPLWRAQPTKQMRTKLLRDETRRWCQNHLPSRVKAWAQHMGLQEPKLSFRFARTRWGSCSSKGRINLNIALLFTPDWVVDSIIIHELSHLVHLNHSRQFWALVNKFDALESASSKWLRAHGQEVLSQSGALFVD